MRRIAKEGVLFAYGATEPEAGSDLGALKTTAEPRRRQRERDRLPDQRRQAVDQQRRRGRPATRFSRWPPGARAGSWSRPAPRASRTASHEDKHGIRLSNTAALFLDKVYVDADRLIGGVEGQGLVQAQQVFGYTRLMVAAFGLGAGWSALDRAIPYSKKRIQAGGPLTEKQGYTHKLIVPHAVALEASRAAIEETAERIDGGEGSLNVEGAVAKYLATEAGDAAADAAIQAHGGYGYTHDYMVEKIKRDVRITRIYEGTSEIMEITIARGRWQEHLKSGGDYYHARARELEALHAENAEVGADVAALAHHALAELLERCREQKLTRHQHILMRLGALIAAGGGRRLRSPGAPSGRRPSSFTRRRRKRLRARRAGGRQPRQRPQRRDDDRDRGRSAGWRQPTAASSAGSSSASTSPRSTAPRAGCLPTCRSSPRRCTRVGALDVPSSRNRKPTDMTDSLDNAVAIVGVGAILPDAPDAAAFWRNVPAGRYSISEVDPARWDPALYYDADPHAPEKTYSKIGGWVRDWDWNPLAWKLPIPPKVGEAMDDGQKWAVACTRMALSDAGWPDRPLDLDRTAVIIGNALAGEQHYLTTLRIMFPELARELEGTEGFAALPAEVRATIERELRADFDDWLPGITEDTMPGELSNCIAGRVSNLFNLHGPSFTTDAACASALAAMDATVDGLLRREFDVAITGGVDRNMGVNAFVKFCAIGALSPTGTRPYADGADGFVMGEGAGLFVVKRLADAVRDGDRIYAVVRGVGGASDGKGKGITAPNPIGQRLAVERGWHNAGLSPAECTSDRGPRHLDARGGCGRAQRADGGFRRRAAGAGIDRARLGQVEHRPPEGGGGSRRDAQGDARAARQGAAAEPQLRAPEPQPRLDHVSVRRQHRAARLGDRRRAHTSRGRQRVRLRRHELPHRDGGVRPGSPGTRTAHRRRRRRRRIGVDRRQIRSQSRLRRPRRSRAGWPPVAAAPVATAESRLGAKPPLRGALVLGAATEEELANELRTALARGAPGAPPRSDSCRAPTTLRAPERIAIDYADGADLVTKAEMALKLMQSGNSAAWPALRGARDLPRQRRSRARSRSCTPARARSTRTCSPSCAGASRSSPTCSTRPTRSCRRCSRAARSRTSSSPMPTIRPRSRRPRRSCARTEITQPAVITVDVALTRLLAEYGIAPDMVMGHSVGEYGALVAAGATDV